MISYNGVCPFGESQYRWLVIDDANEEIDECCTRCTIYCLFAIICLAWWIWVYQASGKLCPHASNKTMKDTKTLHAQIKENFATKKSGSQTFFIACDTICKRLENGSEKRIHSPSVYRNRKHTENTVHVSMWHSVASPTVFQFTDRQHVYIHQFIFAFSNWLSKFIWFIYSKSEMA